MHPHYYQGCALWKKRDPRTDFVGGWTSRGLFHTISRAVLPVGRAVVFVVVVLVYLPK